MDIDLIADVALAAIAGVLAGTIGAFLYLTYAA